VVTSMKSGGNSPHTALKSYDMLGSQKATP